MEHLEDRRVLSNVVVNTHDDEIQNDAVLSLREAIIQANLNAGPDVIQLDAGTYHLDILGSDENGGLSGDLDITDDVTIVVQGAGASTIDATGLNDRILHVIAPLISTQPFLVAGVPATLPTHLNDLDFVSDAFATDERIRINGTLGNGTPVPNADLTINASTKTVGDLLTFVQDTFNNNQPATSDNITVSLDNQGRMVIRPATGHAIGALSLTIEGHPANPQGQADFPGVRGAMISIKGVTLTGGSAEYGGGIMVQNQASVTVTDGRIAGNAASLEGGGFYNETLADRGGMVVLVNTELANNLSGTGSVQDFEVTQFVDLLSDKAASLSDGMNSFFTKISHSIDEGFSKVNLPVVGDKLLEGFGQVQESLDRFGTEVRSLLDDVIAAAQSQVGGPALTEIVQNALYLVLGSTDTSTFDNLPTPIQAVLSPFRQRFINVGLGILIDGPDAGNDIGPSDVVVTLGEDGRGEQWLEFGVMIGQRFTYDTPSFDLGLADLARYLTDTTDASQLQAFLDSIGFNGLELESGNGIRFDMGWFMNLGLGISTVDGQDYYINSGATATGALDAQPVEELRSFIDVFAAPSNEAISFTDLSEDVITTPNLSATVGLGLMKSRITDGVPVAINITAPNGIPLLGDYTNKFTLTYTDADGDHAINIDYNGHGIEDLGSFLLQLNAAILVQTVPAGDLFPPVSVSVDFGRINRLANNDAGTLPSLVFVGRFPTINNLKIDFETAAGAEAWGFLQGQVEDRRARALGFGNNISSTLVGDHQELVGAMDAPIEGRLMQDVEFNLWVGGSRPADDPDTTANESDVVEGAQKVRITFRELFNRDIQTLEELRQKLEQTIQSRVESVTSFETGSFLEVQIEGGKLKIVASSPDGVSPAPLLTVTSQQVEQTKLQLKASVDFIDPNFKDAFNLLRLKSHPNDQRYFDRVTKNDISSQELKGIFSPKLEGNATVNLHVKNSLNPITGLIEQQLGLAQGSIGLPEVEFDFRVVNAAFNFKDLLEDDNSGSGGNSSGSGNEPDTEVENRSKSPFSVKAIQFDNITLDVTKLLETVVIPAAQATIAELQPILAVIGTSFDDPDSILNKEIPLISEIVDERVTLRGIIEEAGLRPAFDVFFDAVDKIANINDTINGFVSRPDFPEEARQFGRFTFGGLELPMDPKHPLYFPRTKIPVPIDLSAAISSGQEAFSWSSLLTTFTASEVVPGVFQLDIVKPDQLFNMLIGAPFNIVSVGLPVVDIDATGDFGFDFDQLAFGIEGNAAIDVNLRLVFDSLGIAHIIDALRTGATPDPVDLLDGLHIQNNPNAEPELGISVDFFGTGGIDIPGLLSASGFVDGHPAAALKVEISDPNDDAKLRLDEILTITNNFANPENLLCIINIVASGFLGAGGTASFAGQSLGSGEMGLVGGEVNLQDLLDLDFCTFDPHDGDPILAEKVIENGQPVLRINTGPFANNRIYKDTDDSDATSGLVVEVTESGGNYIVSVTDPESPSPVFVNSATQTIFAGGGPFTKIVAVGTDYSDHYDFSSVTIPVEFHGGKGDDTAIGGSAGDHLFGDEGNDVLKGRNGNDTLEGDEGDDRLVGGGDAGAGPIGDILIGGRGHDLLLGDRDYSTVVVDSNGKVIDVTLFGTATVGLGIDQLLGDAGNDFLFADKGNDDLSGDIGDDQLFGGDGIDLIDGGRGDDVLDDRSGAGQMFGDIGDDRLVIGRDSRSLVDGAGGANVLVFDDSNYDGLASESLTGAILTPTALRIGSFVNAYHHVGSIEIRLGDGGDTLTILGTSVPVLVSGDADDTGQSDQLIIDRSGEVAATSGQLTATMLTGLGLADVTMQQLEILTLQLSQAGDSLMVNGTPASAATSILGNAGDDSFTVTGVADGASASEITTSVFGGPGDDTVTLGLGSLAPATAAAQGNLSHLQVTVETLIVDNSGYNQPVNWRRSNSTVFFGPGSSDLLIDAPAAQRVLLRAEGSVSNTLTVGAGTGTSLDNPQFVAVDRDSVVINEGAKVLQRLGSMDFNAQEVNRTIDGLSGMSAMAVATTNSTAVGPQTHLYTVGRFDNAVSSFRRNSDGTLSFLQAIKNGDSEIDGLLNPNAVAVSADGRNVYVSGSNGIATLERIPETGRLIYRAKFAHSNASAVVASPQNFVYFISGGSIFRLTRDASGGLSNLNTIASATGYTHLALGSDGTATGENLYAVRPTELVRFHLVSGSVTGTQFLSLNGGSDAAVSADGSNVYVATNSGVRQFHWTGSILADIGFVHAPSSSNPAQARAVAVDPDGSHVMSSFDVNTVPANATETWFQLTQFDIIDRYSVVDPDEPYLRVQFNDEGYGTVFSQNVNQNDPPQNITGTAKRRVFPGQRIRIQAWSGFLVDEQIGTTIDFNVGSGLGVLGERPVEFKDELPAVGAIPATLIAQYNMKYEIFNVTPATPTVDPLVQFARGVNGGLSGLLELSESRVTYFDSLLYAPGSGEFYATRESASALAVYNNNPVDVLLNHTNTIDGDNFLTDGELQTGLQLLALGEDDVSTITVGDYAYSLSAKYAALWVSQRNSTTGNYSQVQQVPVDGLLHGGSLAASNDGHFLYVTNPTEDSILVFERNTSTGLLVDSVSGGGFDPVQRLTDGLGDGSGHTVNGLNGAQGVVVRGNAVYVAGRDDDAIAVFSRNTASGQLTFQSALTHTQLDGPVGLASISAAAIEFLYVASRDNDRVLVFNRDTVNGTITHVQTIVSPVHEPFQLAVSPGFQSVYLAGGDDSIAVFSLISTGQLNLVQTVRGAGFGAVRPLEGLSALAVDNQYVFAAGGNADMAAVFERQADGSLRFLQRIRNGSGDVGLGQLNNPTALGVTIVGDDLLVSLGTGITGSGGLSAFNITRTLPPRNTYITEFTGIKKLLQVEGGANDDEFTLIETASTLPVTINGNAGDDTFFIDGTTLGSTPTLNGGSPASVPVGTVYGDTLVFDTKGEPSPPTVPNLIDGLTGLSGHFPVSGSIRITSQTLGATYTGMEEVIRVAGPTAHAGGPYTIDEGQSVILNATATLNPSGGGAPLYQWDLNHDGVYGDVTGIQPNVSWNTLRSFGLDDGGVYAIGLRVINNVASDLAFTTLTINNLALVPSGADSVNEGSPYALTLSVDCKILSNSGGANTVAFQIVTIDWGDGNVQSFAGGPFGHTYADNGIYEMYATAVLTNGVRVEFTNTFTVNVDDVAPMLVLSGPTNINEGQGYLLQLTASDPGTDTINQWTIDWGDGSVQRIPGNPSGVSHGYPDDGVYAIQATARNEDGNFSGAGPVVKVANLPPTIISTGVLTPNPREGSRVAVFATASDPAGTADPLLYEFDFGNDGTIDERSTTGEASHFYEDDGIFPVRVIVSDGDGGSDSEVFSVVVAKADPQVQLEGRATVDEGSVYSITVRVSDPGDDTLKGYSIDWGDGQVELLTFTGAPNLTPTHIYTDGDSPPYTVRVFALADEDGAYGAEATHKVQVRNVAPIIDLSGVPQQDSTNPFKLLVGHVSDPGRDTVVEYRVHWGDGSTFGGNAYQSFATKPNSVLHTFADGQGFHLIRVVLVDEDGVHPAAGILFVANEGSSVPLQLPILSSSTTKYEVKWADGRVNTYTNADNVVGPGGTAQINFHHVYGDQGVYNVVISLKNAGGASTALTGKRVVVNNVNPTILTSTLTNTSPGCGDVAEDHQVTVGVDFTDPGFDNPMGGTVEDFNLTTIDWGDGHIDTTPSLTVQETPGSPGVLTRGRVTGHHTYVDGGIYTVTIVVRDDDGGEATIVTTTVISGAGVQNGVLQIIGTNGNDQVHVNNQGNGLTKIHADYFETGNFKTFPSQGITQIFMVLCDGDDHGTVAGNIDLITILDGGKGNDHLNAGGGPSVIMGGSGDDKLLGSSGHDILIGGIGADDLNGGPNDDILISGYTAYDLDDDHLAAGADTALLALLSEWNSARSYSNRVQNIQSGLGPILGISGYRLRLLDTVFDDLQNDKLTGASGQNWLFGN